MSKIRFPLLHILLTFLVSFLAAAILLPLVRVYLSSFHLYFPGLKDWLRISSAFFLSILFTVLMFKLLSPKIRHLTHLMRNPPTWLAVFFAWILVAVIDVRCGLDTEGYRATAWEWLGYGGGSLFIVSWYFVIWPEINQWLSTSDIPSTDNSDPLNIQDIENAKWE